MSFDVFGRLGLGLTADAEHRELRPLLPSLPSVPPSHRLCGKRISENVQSTTIATRDIRAAIAATTEKIGIHGACSP